MVVMYQYRIEADGNLRDASHLKLPWLKTEKSFNEVVKLRTLNRWVTSRGNTTLQEQVNRGFLDLLERAGDESILSPWAPAVDILETEPDLVVQAGLPGVNPPALDIRVETIIRTMRGGR